MSARAIQALRKKQGDAAILPVIDDESSSDEDDEAQQPAKASAFAGMMDSSDDESSDEDSSSQEDSDDEAKESNKVEEATKKPEQSTEAAAAATESAQPEPDLDDLLQEFQAKDGELADQATEDGGAVSSGPSPYRLILADIEPKDLDYDFAMRTSLLGGGSSAALSAARPRKNRQALLFGPARDGWSRPPHYVGGGIGMTSYDREPRPLPWPYRDSAVKTDMGEMPLEDQNDAKALPTTERNHWFTFMHSDSYQQDCEDYKQIQQSGDMNALIMFVAHHPFVTQALLQLTTVLYQTNHSQEGLALLRRCLWIYECSSLLSFTRSLDGNAYMDYKQPENETYFRSLFRLVQVSNIAGLPTTSLAVSRYILSLDPLRDPMGVLLAADHYALASNSAALEHWLVNLVDSEILQIRYRDARTSKSYRCGLLDLPNWAFSYALALLRLHNENPCDETKARADKAIQSAMSMYPSIVGMLLQQNEVDTTGRSFRRDWLSVMDYATDRTKQLRNAWWSDNEADTVILTATMQACALIVKIFVQQNAKLYADDHVLQWLFENLAEMQSTKPELVPSPNPAMLRYASCDPSDYEKKIQMLPQDMNLIEPGLIAHAMEVNTNRGRFIRRMNRGGGDGMDGLDANGMPGNRARLLGPPMNNIDPDWPLAEVFWRSFLPWNHVEGLPPPPR